MATSGGSYGVAGATPTITYKTLNGYNITVAGTPYRPSSPAAPVPTVTLVTPTYDPKIEANALYGKRIILWALGYGRIGSAPAPLVGPYINSGKVDFLVSLGVPANPSGTRKIYKLYFDNELAWHHAAGWDGTGANPGTFTAESFDIEFRQGTLTQAVCSLETEKFSGEAIAYRPQALVQIRNLVFQRFLDRGGKPTPYVAAELGDTTDGADPFDGIGVGEGLERIAHSPWCGYDASSFESIDIADITPGYMIADNINIDQLCQNVAGIYRNLDYTHTDKRRIKDRGNNVSPDIVFTRDTILGGEGAIQIFRTDASAEPRELELLTVDPDQDYTAVPSVAKRPRDPVVTSSAVDKQSMSLPLVMDASTRQAMVTFAQYDRKNSRKKIAFQAMAYGYKIQPGDLFAIVYIADGIDDEVFKCTETSHGANYVVEVQGQAVLRCRLYDPDGPAAIPITPQQVITGSGTATFTGFTAAAGDLVVLLLAGFRSITTARNLMSVTVDGHAATIHDQEVNNHGGAGPNLAIASLVMPSALTGSDVISVVYDGPNTSAAMIPYVVTNYTSPSPTDIKKNAVPSGDPGVLLNVPDTGVAFALWVGSGGTPAAATFTGLSTEDYDTTGLALGGSIQVAAAHQTGLGADSSYDISATSTMTAETIIAASWA
jgi:hypothetical protein